MNDIVALLGKRAEQHGDFAETARMSQTIRSTLRCCPKWPDLSPEQREALDMIAVKMARIVSGNPDELDHWIDIAGYAELGKPR